MSTTYQLHQLVNNEKNQPYIFAKYSEIVRKNHPIREEDYQKAYSGVAHFDDTPEILMSRLSEMDLSAGRARAVSRSDVLVFIQDGRKQCFYYDNPALIPIEGFFFGSASANGGIEINYVLKPAVLSVERQKHARHIRNGLSIPILVPFQENPE